MSSDCLNFKDTHRFSKLVEDYANSHPQLVPFFNRPFCTDSFGPQMAEKAQNYPTSHRAILVDALKEQYAHLKVSKSTLANMESLSKEDTFTVTTGHQLNLFTGPLYFWYKIIDTLKLASHLNTIHPTKKIVPIFWMATEDHDFEEINHFNLNNLTLSWAGVNLGPVGRRDVKGLESVLKLLQEHLQPGFNRDYLTSLFEKSYNNCTDLSTATRFLVNELFGEDGLVILDADHPKLKSLFVPYFQEELLQQTACKSIEATSEALQENYHKQVNPRDINLFYITQNSRTRIERQNDGLFSSGTDYRWSEAELLHELELHPDRFSPNALLRPLYQEVILPNICYVGGGAEVAYWMQLKSYFRTQSMTFPILKIRNSAVLLTSQQENKWLKLGLSKEDYLQPIKQVTDKFALSGGEGKPNFEGLYKQLAEQFDTLKQFAKATDPSFSSALEAQLRKQKKGLQNLEKRWLRAQNKLHQQAIFRVQRNYHSVNPGGKLQERFLNFAPFYNEFGSNLKSQLMHSLDPMTQGFYVISL